MFFNYSSKVWSATQPELSVGNKQNAEHAKLNIQSNVFEASDEKCSLDNILICMHTDSKIIEKYTFH